jgi:hypothetical protein
MLRTCATGCISFRRIPPARSETNAPNPPASIIWPAASQPVFHDLSYYMHEGGHGMVSSDWSIYIEFLRKTLHTNE